MPIVQKNLYGGHLHLHVSVIGGKPLLFIRFVGDRRAGGQLCRKRRASCCGVKTDCRDGYPSLDLNYLRAVSGRTDVLQAWCLTKPPEEESATRIGDRIAY
jgi:hypothetical protein